MLKLDKNKIKIIDEAFVGIANTNITIYNDSGEVIYTDISYGCPYLNYLTDNLDSEEKLFGILIEKDSDEYKIGKTNVCSCSADASFEEFKKKDCEFYNTIEKIVKEKIID